jgi:hypothetical protein
MSAAVTLSRSTRSDSILDALAADLPGDVPSALSLARLLGRSLTPPGHGSTRRVWEVLATLAAHDLGSARAIEPHLDALAILNQAPECTLPGVAMDPDCTWGVFAAEGGDAPLVASVVDRGDEVADAAGPGSPHQEDTSAGASAWRISGVKPWCSLSGVLRAALVTAATSDGERRLFAVDLRQDGVDVVEGVWAARGLTEIPSGPMRFDSVAAFPVGEAGWYLERAGFSWGGMGVASCWYGGAVGLARALHASAAARPEDRLLAMHLGAVDQVLQSARRALDEGATLIDAGEATGAGGRLAAKRIRAAVASSCEDVLVRVGHALGPAPLALDPAHAKRVADLEIYLRQHHAERDDASLGESLARSGTPPW